MSTKSICVFAFLFIALAAGASVFPSQINVQSGVRTNQGIEVLQTNELTGTTDGYDSYISFNGRNPRFIGLITFNLGSISASSVSSAVINVNYRGPRTSQTWRWSAVSPSGSEYSLGVNSGIPQSWVWTPLSFNIPSFSSYVSSSNVFTLKYESVNTGDSSQFDFLELYLTTSSSSSSTTGTPPPTPTPTPCSAPYTQSSCTKAAVCTATNGPTKMMIPLYIWPTASESSPLGWTPVVEAAALVDIVAIINPDNGPYAEGTNAGGLATYNTGINNLVNAGAKVVGYVSSDYGRKDIEIVKNHINLYKQYYPDVSGIFIDEVDSNDVYVANTASYYTQVSNHIKTKFDFSVFNPGDISQNYFASFRHLATVHLVTELAQVNLTLRIPELKTKINNYCTPSSPNRFGYKYAFSGVVHTTSSSATSWKATIDSLVNTGMGYVYVTDQKQGGNGMQYTSEYSPLATYFDAQVAYIDTL